MGMEPGEHHDVLLEAIAIEADAQRRLLAGDAEGGGERLRAAVERYRTSWELAPARSYGRLLGMLKAAIIAGAGATEAAYARAAVGPQGDSPPSWYVLGLAALVAGDDELATVAAGEMRAGSPPFGRAADAMAALALGDAAAYASAVDAIVADFETRSEHLTGVAIADTALMFERLAARRGLAAGRRSALLPAA